MLEFIQGNLPFLAGAGGLGAIVGGLTASLVGRRNNSNKIQMNEATISNLRTLTDSLEQYKGGINLTKNGFSNIISLLTPFSDKVADILPGALQSKTEDISSTTEQMTEETNHITSQDTQENVTTSHVENKATPEADALSGTALAEKLLATVMGIPGLPLLPDFNREFELLSENPMVASLFRQLKNLDASKLNPMLDEFKSLVESNLKSGIEHAKNKNVDFQLEPETIDTMLKGASEFTKTIEHLTGGLDGSLAKINDLIKQFSK